MGAGGPTRARYALAPAEVVRGGLPPPGFVDVPVCPVLCLCMTTRDTIAVARSRLGPSAGTLTWEELAGVRRAIQVVLGLAL